MKTNLLNIEGVNVLSRKSQSQIKGQAGVDLSLCGCDCKGTVVGPAYCHKYIVCPQDHTC
ncbi:hypothetical protein [Aquimarina aquimarini]|uniref:hypothetical protein n=1 Tax=Aquimarina aquimarini TaxID=1191734 RepID=UPI000D54EF62|nr:hypothetical protein [Aquimarina aquimarini]